MLMESINRDTQPMPTPLEAAGLTHEADPVSGLLVRGGSDATNEGDEFIERRKRVRHITPGTFRLIPLSDEGTPLHRGEVTVVGRDITVTGFGFTYNRPLAFKRAYIMPDEPDAPPLTVEIEIVWTKKNSVGLHEFGCRLVRSVSKPTRQET